MARDQDPQTLLLANIKNAAERVLADKMPAAWTGSQLAALIRFWG